MSVSYSELPIIYGCDWLPGLLYFNFLGYGSVLSTIVGKPFCKTHRMATQ